MNYKKSYGLFLVNLYIFLIFEWYFESSILQYVNFAFVIHIEWMPPQVYIS